MCAVFFRIQISNVSLSLAFRNWIDTRKMNNLQLSAILPPPPATVTIREWARVRETPGELKSKKYMVYVIEVSCQRRRSKWIISQRFSNFYALRKEILAIEDFSKCKDCVAYYKELKELKFPGRKVLHAGMERNIVKSRVILLESFLQKAIDIQEAMSQKCRMGQLVPKRAGIIGEFENLLNMFVLPSRRNSCANIDPSDVVSNDNGKVLSLSVLSTPSTNNDTLLM